MQQARHYQKNEKRKASELDFHKVLRGASLVAQLVKTLPAMQETQV